LEQAEDSLLLSSKAV